MDPIKTKRLVITPFDLSYLTDRYVSWLNDSEVTRFSRHRSVTHTIKSCRDYYLSFQDSPNYLWAIEILDGDTLHIGNVNAYIDEPNSTADVGILIGEKTEWGKGYAYEAWIAICNYLFTIEKVRKISASTLSTNKSMVNLARQAKMSEERRRFHQVIFEGKKVDVINFAYHRKEWWGVYSDLVGQEISPSENSQ